MTLIFASRFRPLIATPIRSYQTVSGDLKMLRFSIIEETLHLSSRLKYLSMDFSMLRTEFDDL